MIRVSQFSLPVPKDCFRVPMDAQARHPGVRVASISASVFRGLRRADAKRVRPLPFSQPRVSNDDDEASSRKSVRFRIDHRQLRRSISRGVRKDPG